MKTRSQRRKGNKRAKSKRTRSASGRFECDSCSKTFAWKKDLFRHEKAHEPNTRKYPCPHCERRFYRKDKLSSHLLVHLTGIPKARSLKGSQNFAHCLFSEKKFIEKKCMLCGYTDASDVRELRRHISSHKNLAEIKDLASSDVVSQFYPNQDLKEVIPLITSQIEAEQFTKLHSIINGNTYEMGISDSDDSDPDDEIEYLCEVCSVSFNRKHKLIMHQAYEHSLKECPFECAVCTLKFTSRAVLDSHLKHHCENPDRTLDCGKCFGRFTWPKNLGNHKCDECSPKKESVKCEICQLTFPNSKALRVHKKTHIPTGKSRECPVCGEKFLRMQTLQTHLKKHSKKRMQSKKLSCTLCNAEFANLSSLKLHLFTHSDGQSGVDFKNCTFVSTFYPEASEGTVSEHIRSCFSEKKLWRLYIAVNKLGLEMVLSDSDSEDEDEPPVKKTQSDKYTCELCDIKYPHMQAILQHQQSQHIPETTVFPRKCDKCGEGFICVALLWRHTKSECLNEDRVQMCAKCGFKFMWKRNFLVHSCIRGMKTADDQRCEFCGKKFIWLKDLHRHRRSHMPEQKKFECLVCNRKFNRKDNMRAHMKVHETDNNVKSKNLIKWQEQDENVCHPHGSKIIQCKICFSKHNSIRDLTNHLMTHKDRATLKQEECEVEEVSTLIYNKSMDLESLSQAIGTDLQSGHHSRFYSITNEVGYELSLIDSETCSEMDADDFNDDDDDDDPPKGYACQLCNKIFNRKFKIFDHQTKEHSWEDLPFSCKHCSAKFVCESLYFLHLQNECENSDKQFKCKKCPLKFTWKDNLKTHEKRIHDKNPISPRKHLCNSCDKSFLWQKDLVRHRKIHQQQDDEKFECTWCFRVFMRRDNLKVHMKVHQNANHLLLPQIYYLARPNGAKVAECKLCEQRFSSISELQQHNLTEHVNQPKVEKSTTPGSYSITNALGYEMDIEDSETENEEPPEKYSCELCDTRFNRRFKLLQHQQSLHYSDNIPHKCTLCNFKCVSKPIIMYHLRTQCMNTAKKFQCNKCTMRFLWQENLENHESLIHESPSKHTCEVCKKDFPTQHDLKTHANCKPPDEIKFFECQLCNRKYNRKDRLMKHVKEHSDEAKGKKAKSALTPEKRFLCAFCGKAVSSSSNLIIHMRRHTGEKPFKCEFCNKGFPRSSDLSCHRRTHTGERPHKCTICDKAFSRSYKLQTHMRIHSGIRPYKCTYCDKSFTQSNDLTLHVRRHTGERPYTCETCGEKFIQGTALRNHRRMRGHYEA